MPRRRNKRNELDFEIHVDPSEDTAPMEDSSEHHEVISDLSDIGAGGFADEDDNHSTFEPNWISHGGSELNCDSDGTEPGIRQSIEEDEDMENPASRRESVASRRSTQSSTQGQDDLRQSTLRGKHQYRTSVAASDDSYGSSSSRQSMSVASESRMSTGARSQPSGGEDSGSHRDEQEDDVFSDNSPRSSMGSIPEGDQHKMDDAGSRRTTTSRISDISPYDPEEEFVPTMRGTPRPPFRSPSSVRDIQMNSPPASVIGSPRRSKGTPRRSTMSRLGSPSTQFSPKKTPPRFKRNTPPLVLLHVTLLPLRWPWGDLLDSVRPSELSEAGKALREAWRQLQDCVGDTVCDRGILLPHPQNDFEVLEERLLEAVELPLRRRARILECGHYLGPANDMTLAEDMDSEDEEEYEARLADDRAKTHWCSTCHSEIRYDSLGEGRVFRTKVYASNGLMKAGAWDACWKQMERVDVEVEPIVDEFVLDELEHLAAEQSARLDEEHELEADRTMYEATTPHATTFSSPPPQSAFEETPLSNDRRMRDEERLREIYGQSPPPEAAPSTAPPAPRPEDFIAPETPPSPTVEALERRESRRQSYKSASLPELVLEAVKVLMQDKKNIAIALLGFIVMMLAVRSGQEPLPTKVVQPVIHHDEAVVSRDHPPGYEVEKGDPCAVCSLALEEAQASCAGGPATVTVTETYTASVTIEATTEATTADATTADATTADAFPTEEAQGEIGEFGDEAQTQQVEIEEAAEHDREL